MDRESAAALAKLEPKLAPWIRKLGQIDFKLQKTRSPYEALVTAVVYQQLHGKAAATILGRVKALFPGSPFPSPEALLAMPEERLREAGLSRSKLAAVQDIARKTLDGTVPTLRVARKLPEKELIEALTSIRGVGRWTVEMFLIFRLGRPDVLPAGDYGVQKGFMRVFGKRRLPTEKELAAYGERWQPYRTTAALYLWRASDAE
jgi:DNA-3-methyladenine glycosylase II